MRRLDHGGKRRRTVRLRTIPQCITRLQRSVSSWRSGYPYTIRIRESVGSLIVRQLRKRYRNMDTETQISNLVRIRAVRLFLRPYQFCNLTEAVVRHDDTEETLLRKVRIAAILGTIQATFTKFPYLRKVWQRNTEEERLLGVSLTGIYDNPLLTTQGEELNALLSRLREEARRANEEYATLLGIPKSAAITCVKPSGTVSQLVDSASGIHPRHSKFYIRRVRGDKKDPLTQFLIQQGIPNEACVYKPDQTVVFSFPQKAPAGITRADVTPISHLELWLIVSATLV